MTIAIDIRALSQGVGGVAEYTRNIVRTLIATEKTHTYILFANSWKNYCTDWIAPSGPRHTIVQCRYPNKFFHLAQMTVRRPCLDTLVQRMSGRKPDLFFFPNVHFAALSGATPAVLTVHDFSFMVHPQLLSAKSYWWHRCTRPSALIARMNHIIAVSDSTKRDCIALCKKSPQDITVVHHDCDQSSQTQPADAQSSHPRTYIILLGAHEQRKNAFGALEAFALLWRRNPAVRIYTLVLIAKEGSLFRRIARRIQQYEMEGAVLLFSTQSEKEKRELFARARVLLYPSIYEGFGLPLVEAARAGVRIVSSGRGGIGEVIGNGALLVDPCNVHDMEYALEYALCDEGGGSQSIRTSAFQAAKQYSWETTAAATRSVFETVVKEARL